MSKTNLATSKVHFIGIGGIGMCGLAELLHNMGAEVSGSDMAESEQTRALQATGIQVEIGHQAKNVADAEVVVYSSAIKPNNVEYAKAKELKIPLIPRAEALAELMKLKRGLAIAGTHGKTTTTSLASQVFLKAQQDPTVVIGGRLALIGSTAQLGQGDWLIAEADESDGSFNRLAPEVVVITNVDEDHIDHYGTFGRLQEAFLDFASRIPFFGQAIVYGDDPLVRSLFEDFGKKISFYGFEDHNDFQLKGSKQSYEVFKEGEFLGEMLVPMPGQHNALNALAALIAGMAAGISFVEAKEGIAGFSGVGRRFQHKGEMKGIDFYDDYGHHPTEIRAFLQGLSEAFPQRRKVVLFQPHRYSRTQLCWDEFLACFNCCDKLLLTDIYPAGEPPIEGITARRLARSIDHSNCELIERHRPEFANHVASLLQQGDVFVTLGAGDVWRVGEEIFAELKNTEF